MQLVPPLFLSALTPLLVWHILSFFTSFYLSVKIHAIQNHPCREQNEGPLQWWKLVESRNKLLQTIKTNFNIPSQEMDVAVAFPAPAVMGKLKETSCWRPWLLPVGQMAASLLETSTISGGFSLLGMLLVSWSWGKRGVNKEICCYCCSPTGNLNLIHRMCFPLPYK